MEVRIKEEVYEYVPDFPVGWRFAKGDHFRFPVVIGPEKCFIKRFDKHTDDITGWNLLQYLAGKTEDKNDTLAKVYDTVSVIENNKIVHYVFFEYVEGQSLHDCIAEKAPLNLTELTNDLFTAIQMLQINGHWFPDFVEKNIFRNENGRFLLVDLDSTHPTSNLPDNEMWGGKDYWILVVNFYKNILNQNDISLAHFNGVDFNCLHAVFLILRLTIFYNDEAADYDFLFDQLPYRLNSISPLFREVFTKVYRRREQLPEPKEITEIRDLVLKKIIPLNTNEGSDTITEAPDPGKHPVNNTPEPVINTFKVTNYIENTGESYLIANGESFELTWDVQNASKIELYRKDKLYKTFDSQQKTIEVNEQLYDSPSKKVKYTLVAWNGNIKTEQSLVAEILFEQPTPSDPPFTIKINDFSVREAVEKKDDQYVIISGQPFTLQWDVENAQKVELYRNGALYKQFKKDENSIEIEERIYDSTAKLIEYTLIISNSNNLQELVEKASLKVSITYQEQAVKPEADVEENAGENNIITESEIISGKRKGFRIALIATGCLVLLLFIIFLVRNKPTDDTLVESVDHKDTAKAVQVDTQTIQEPRIIPDTINKKGITIIHDHLYYDSLGNEYARKKDYIEAIRNYEIAIQKNNNYAKAYYNRGMAEHKLGYYDPAIDDYTKAIQLNLNDGSVYYNRGLAELNAGLKDIACNDFQKSCNLGYNKGCEEALAQHCKRIDEEMVIKDSLFEATRYNNKGISKERSGDYRGAIKDYTSAIKLYPKQSLYYNKRGYVKYLLANNRVTIDNSAEALYKEAIDDYTEALRLEPNYLEVYYLRGLAELKLNDKKNACKDFNEMCNREGKKGKGCAAARDNCNSDY